MLEVAARADGPCRLATEVGIQGPSAVRQIQESGLIGRLWPYGACRFDDAFAFSWRANASE